MSQVTYLTKIGELTLKGKNLKEFEKRLKENTRLYLEKVKARVTLRAGRMYIEGPEESCEAIEFTLRHLIGITGWARAHACSKDVEEIKATVMKIALQAREEGKKTFKIDVRRADKSFPLNSYELTLAASNDVYDQGILGVDLHNPDVFIRIEVRERVFIYGNANKGCRGLPVGVSGRGLLLLSGGLDSPVAGYRMLRRGMKIECIYFHAYPYTSDEAQQKVEALAQKLALFGLDTHLNSIPFTEVQLHIKNNAPEAFTTLMLRVCMIKAANLLAERVKAQCLITGESLGQVASQTVENMSVTESVSDYPLFRPLIGLDKEEIIDTAHFIDTYKTSILPYEDCCVLFTPKHPILRAQIAEVKEIYENLSIDSMILEAFEKRTVTHYSARDYVARNFASTN